MDLIFNYQSHTSRCRSDAGQVFNLRNEKNLCFLSKSGGKDTWCLRFLAKNRRHQVSPGTVFLNFQFSINI